MFSSADLKSGTSAGSPVLLVQGNCAAACEGLQAKTFGRFNNSPGRWRQGLNSYISKSYGHILTIVNYEVLLYSVKEKLAGRERESERSDSDTAFQTTPQRTDTYKVMLKYPFWQVFW